MIRHALPLPAPPTGRLKMAGKHTPIELAAKVRRGLESRARARPCEGHAPKPDDVHNPFGTGLGRRMQGGRGSECSFVGVGPTETHVRQTDPPASAGSASLSPTRRAKPPSELC